MEGTAGGLLRRTGIRVYFWGFLIAFGLSFTLTEISEVFILRYDGRALLIGVGIVIVLGALIFPLTIVYMRSLYKRIRKAVEKYERLSEGDGSADVNEIISAVEALPVRVSIMAFVIVLFFYAVAPMILYHAGSLYNRIVLVQMFMGLSFAIMTAYLEYFVLHYILEDIKKKYYGLAESGIEIRNSSIRIRIMSLVVMLTAVPVVFCWATGVTEAIFMIEDRITVSAQTRIATVKNQLLSDSLLRLEDFSKDDYLQIAYTEIIDKSGNLICCRSDGGFSAEMMDAGFMGDVRKEALSGEPMRGNRKKGSTIWASLPVDNAGQAVIMYVPLSHYLDPANRMGFLFFLICSILAISSVVMGYLTVQAFTGPLKKLVKAAGSVAEGDLSVEVEINSADEVGVLSGAFSRMVASLKEITLAVKNTAAYVNGEASDIAASSQQASTSIDHLNGVISQLSANSIIESNKVLSLNSEMSEIMGVIENNYSRACEEAEFSKTASSLAEDGRRSARGAVEQMDAVNMVINTSSESVRDLGQRMNRIGKIVEVINSIADQTNLLALNAAIEAARAGESGKGFSVVAEEVKRLAEDSSRETSEITVLINEIMRDVEATVQGMEKIMKEMRAGMGSVNNTGEALNEICVYAERTSLLSMEVAESLNLIMERSGGVMEAIDEIRGAAESNAASSEEISASAEQQGAQMSELADASQRLAEAASKLEDNVRQFRIAD